MSLVIGYDPGFGNVKVCVGGKTQVIQAAASVPRSVGLAATGLKSAGRNVQRVNINGHVFTVGEGAASKGTLKTSMDYLSLTSLERQALLYAALAPLLPHKADEAVLVVGLPVPLLEDATLAQTVLDSLKQFKTTHTFTVNECKHTFTIGKIKVLAQPAGAYLDWAHDDDLTPRAGASKQEVLVVDIGMNTLDVYVLRNGQVVEAFVGGAEVGVRRLLELLAVNGRDVMELDADLRNGALKLDSAQLDSYLGEVLAALKRITPNLKRFGLTIACGGGAMVLGDRLRLALSAKGTNVYWPPDPITTNVRGFWKYGLKFA